MSDTVSDIGKKFDFLLPHMTYFKGKKNHLRRAVIQIFQHKNQKKIETPKTKEKCLFLNSLIYLLPIQNYMKP